MRAKSSLVCLLLLVVLVGVVPRTVNAQPVHVSVQPNPVPAGQSFMIAFWITVGTFSGHGTATVHIRTCNACGDIWQSTPMTVAAGLDYEVYPSGISTPGTYIAFVEVIGPPSGGLPGAAYAGYADFNVGGSSGSSGSFDFSISLSPASATVKPGETATFQILLTYSDPSYAGTTINVQVSGLGPGMDYQVIQSPPALQVSTSSSTPPGSYTISLTGSANGIMHQANALLTVQATQPFDFSISASPTQQTITPGGSTTSTITVTLSAGTAQSVALTVSGAPNGVSASLNPTSGTPSFSSILSITTSPSVAPGQYALTITATAGTTSHPTTFTLTVGQSPDFRIDVSTPSQTTAQGGSVTYQLSVASMNGFNSPVTLSVSGLPSGANGVFTIGSGTPDFSSALTVTVPADAPAGSYTLQVTGAGGGLNRAANLVLNISPAPQTSTQTSAQTSSPSGIDLMGILQQNGLLVLAAIIVVVGAALVLSRRGRPSGPTRAPQGPTTGVTYCHSCGKQNPAGHKFCGSCGEEL